MKGKIVKKRGSKSHGYGSKKKHRGSGSRGGRGRAGFKHKKIMFRKQDLQLGKRGFKSLSQRDLKVGTSPVNLRDLDFSMKEIDVTELGYDKVLGTGEVKKPVTIKARAFSENAKKKIEQAKGKAIII